MRSAVLNSGRLASAVLSAILFGTWVNIYSDRLSTDGYLTTLRQLGTTNLVLVAGLGSLVGSEYLARRWRNVEHEQFEHRYGLLRRRQERLLETTLKVVCELVSKTLQVPCNARYFIARRNGDGRTFLEQDRHLAVLNLRMPREFGFTKIAVDTPHIVSGRAYLERTPLYEELPADHHKLYDSAVAKMIEPRQRWVLACPVLALEPEDDRHDEANPPHGVIVFYGTTVPPAAHDGEHIEAALEYAQLFADQMSHMLNMLNLSQGAAAKREPGHEPVA